MLESTHTPGWFEDWFGEDYLKVYPHRDADEARQQVDFVEKALPLNDGEHILDLGCGGGRHAINLSERGYQVTCLDLSPVLLALAQSKNPSDNCCLRFIRADMRHLPFRPNFDAVLSFFTTFGYFETDEENLSTLRSVENILISGGRFLQDYMNKPYVINNLVRMDSKIGNGFEVLQERTYNMDKERIEKKITLKEGTDVREYFESVRLYTLDEMERLLARAGLRLEAIYGDFDGSPFTEESPRLVMMGRKETN